MKAFIKIYYKISKNHHNNNGDFLMNKNYYYKGYDITNTNRLEKYMMEYQNPYGYNLESSRRRIVDYDKKVTKTNQDTIKNSIIHRKD